MNELTHTAKPEYTAMHSNLLRGTRLKIYQSQDTAICDNTAEDDATGNSSKENMKERYDNSTGNSNGSSSKSMQVKKRGRNSRYFKPCIELNNRH